MTYPLQELDSLVLDLQVQSLVRFLEGVVKALKVLHEMLDFADLVEIGLWLGIRCELLMIGP